MTTSIVFFVVGAYLIGSVSSAIIVTRLFAIQDIRQQGSGNAGATNVLRVAGKKAAAIVFLFDLLKGAIPVYAGFLFGLAPIALSLVAIAACLGHIFPVFFQFKGGKGVATALGALMPLDWALAGCLFGTWLCVFTIARISSVAAIVTFSLAPIYTYIFEPDYTIAVTLLCLLIIGKHRDNIKRLFSSKEKAKNKS
ncbi:glycerol-3-phosphate 1-O-acyltransferase PlsY [Glaciecola petra]|uniref:Glycerol-3-phosphate acyltransferase n=1 Tax=Glaciecola petra TaxID=3075602 RepID=A0ABU2ZLX5_9ALTE|nr:glycerol-3-phosphate 1-O-acyltransferase PlsY [Aestuariibacter sp. P117]MDT0593405.1 glycerol-3-phosphate 1-O-acyltransferase PlsY [Aestuariibacter sp. P117]